MNKQVTALALVFCLLSSTFAALPSASSSQFSELLQFEKTPFGRSILTTVELHLKSGEPVQNLIGLLNQMLRQLEEEQTAADAIHTDFQDSCTSDIAILHQEIDAATLAKTEAVDQLNIDEPRLQVLLETEARLQQEIIDTEAFIVQLHKNRADEKAAFEEHVQQIEEALVVFQGARKLMERTSDEYASLIQKSSSLKAASETGAVFAQISSQLSKVHLQRKGWNSIAKVLAQLLSRAERLANQGLVTRVLSLFDELISNLNEGAVAERRNEQTRIEIYQRQLSEATQKLNDLTAELNQTQYEIHVTSVRIEQNRAKLQEAIRTLQEKNAQLEHRTAECRDEQSNYDNQSTTRTEERGIIAQVIEILESRLGLLKQYAQSRE